jgi:hypothetical protein
LVAVEYVEAGVVPPKAAASTMSSPDSFNDNSKGQTVRRD